MSKPETERLKLPAFIAGQFLAASLFICIGFAVAQMKSVKNTQEAIRSGELQAELLPYAKDSFDKQIYVLSTVPNALDGGAILIGPEFSTNLLLLLINEQGLILHRWHVANGLFNPAILKFWKNVKLDTDFYIEDAHLLPGGDVIFIQGIMGLNNFRGQRLARMDRDSHIIWQVPGTFHHFIHIGGNPQRIYAMSSSITNQLPDIAPQLRNVRYLKDWVEAYTLDGKKVGAWSIPEAFARSPYRNWLTSFVINAPTVQRIRTPDGRTLYDFFHPNSVQYLDAAKAKALPFAQEGDLLLSLRTLNALAVLRPATNQIVWAGKGPWYGQHNAQANEDGKLYIYDNEGRQVVRLNTKGQPKEQMQSRIIRYNPFNNQMEEIFAASKLFSPFLGNYQQLAGDSWIISYPWQGRVVVASPEKKVVWQMRTIPDFDRFTVPYRKEISFMHYYPASALEFLHQPDTGNAPHN